MHTFSKSMICLALLPILALGGCDDDKKSEQKPTQVTSTKDITLTPSLGKIIQGRAVLKNALTGQAIVDIKSIGADGTVSFTVDTSKLKDPIIAEILPTAAGKLEYADEAITDKIVTINAAANTPILRAATMITADKTNLGVTALTEAALTYAQTLSAQLTQANLDAANKAVKDQLKLTKFNLTDAPAIVGLNDFSPLLNTALVEQQRAYAAYLATLAKEARRLNTGSTQPAYDILQALSKDLSDGKFDAKQNTTALGAYNNAWIQAWSNWVSVFYDSIFKLQNAGDLSAWLAAFNAVSPSIPTPTPVTTAKPIRTVDGVAEYACGDEKALKSASGSALNIDFVNQSSGAINIDWINQAGTLNRYSTGLATGKNYIITPTYVTHPWKITDSKGICKGIFVATTATNKTLTIKGNEIVIGKETTTPTTETCASKKLPVGKLSDLTAYSGEYKDKNNVVLNLNAATGTAIANGTNATIKEVCGENVQSNGTNFYVITDKGYVTLFKDNTGKYSAESADFSGFYGEKASTTSQLCESNGADDKLGFKNAPSDFCGFTKSTSIAITSPDIYTFFNTDKKENIKITVQGSNVKSVQIENTRYAWECGISTACTGVTVKDGQINSKSAKSFYFNNTVLKVVSGTTQDLTVKNNSLLMHLDNSQLTNPEPTPTNKSCEGNTNEWGCVTVSGNGTSIKFLEHNQGMYPFPSASGNAFSIVFTYGLDDHSAWALYAVDSKFSGVTSAQLVHTNTYGSADASKWEITTYGCGGVLTDKDRAYPLGKTCTGLSVDQDKKTVTLKNVMVQQFTTVENGNRNVIDKLGSVKISLDGTLKYK